MIPLWIPLLAIGLGLFGLALVIKHRPSVHVDEDFAEDLRRQQVDAAFRISGEALLRERPHVVRSDFQRVGTGR
jgi:hypothetical protein